MAEWLSTGACSAAKGTSVTQNSCQFSQPGVYTTYVAFTWYSQHSVRQFDDRFSGWLQFYALPSWTEPLAITQQLHMGTVCPSMLCVVVNSPAPAVDQDGFINSLPLYMTIYHN
jgi:hypothetical protein